MDDFFDDNSDDFYDDFSEDGDFMDDDSIEDAFDDDFGQRIPSMMIGIEDEPTDDMCEDEFTMKDAVILEAIWDGAYGRGWRKEAEET